MLGRPRHLIRWVRLNIVRPTVRSFRKMIRDVIGVYRGGARSPKHKRLIEAANVEAHPVDDDYIMGDDGEMIRKQKGGSQL